MIDWFHFNWLDYTIVAILLVSLVIGVIRGFICELISVITWVLAFFLAYQFAAPIASSLSVFLDSEMVRYTLAFAGIFILVLVLGITINVIIRNVWHRSGVPGFDRLLGLIFGVMRAVLIIAFLLLLVRSSDLQEEPAIQGSQLIPHFKVVVDWLGAILPEKVTDISQWVDKEE